MPAVGRTQRRLGFVLAQTLPHRELLFNLSIAGSEKEKVHDSVHWAGNFDRAGQPSSRGNGVSLLVWQACSKQHTGPGDGQNRCFRAYLDVQSNMNETVDVRLVEGMVIELRKSILQQSEEQWQTEICAK